MLHPLVLKVPILFCLFEESIHFTELQIKTNVRYLLAIFVISSRESIFMCLVILRCDEKCFLKMYFEDFEICLTCFKTISSKPVKKKSISCIFVIINVNYSSQFFEVAQHWVTEIPDFTLILPVFHNV